MGFRSMSYGRSLVSVLLAGMLVILAVSAIPRAHADDGVTVEVEVLGTSASPTPSATPTATATASGTPTSTGSPTTTSSPSSSSSSGGTGSPTASGSTTPGGETSIGGVLFISGLTMAYTPSINPFDGRVDMRFTVRNAYKKAVDGKAIFWVTAWFGNRVGHQVEVSVPDIAPGETRLVTATIRGVGQWGILAGHVTFVPPPSLDSVTLTAVTRTGTIVYIPWFPAVCLAGGSAFWFALRRRGAWYEVFAAIGGRR
jgi:hypothetical protein